MHLQFRKLTESGKGGKAADGWRKWGIWKQPRSSYNPSPQTHCLVLKMAMHKLSWIFTWDGNIIQMCIICHQPMRQVQWGKEQLTVCIGFLIGIICCKLICKSSANLFNLSEAQLLYLKNGLDCAGFFRVPWGNKFEDSSWFVSSDFN